MVPRLEIKHLKIKSTVQEIIDQIQGKVCSRYPVCDGTLDKTIGILHVKDLALVRGQSKKDFNIKNFLKDPFFVYEHMKIQAVFDYMNRKKIHLALVKNENDLIVGIVTLEDIIEEVMGEIHDEHDEEQISPDPIVDSSRDGIVWKEEPP